MNVILEKSVDSEHWTNEPGDFLALYRQKPTPKSKHDQDCAETTELFVGSFEEFIETASESNDLEIALLVVFGEQSIQLEAIDQVRSSVDLRFWRHYGGHKTLAQIPLAWQGSKSVCNKTKGLFERQLKNHDRKFLNKVFAIPYSWGSSQWTWSEHIHQVAERVKTNTGDRTAIFEYQKALLDQAWEVALKRINDADSLTYLSKNFYPNQVATHLLGLLPQADHDDFESEFQRFLVRARELGLVDIRRVKMEPGNECANIASRIGRLAQNFCIEEARRFVEQDLLTKFVEAYEAKRNYVASVRELAEGDGT